MKFNINSCKACKKNYDIKDINSINSCCFETLGAFMNAPSINSFINTPEAQNCKDCVTESKKALGRDLCEFRLGPAPTWVQVPHYFPALLVEENNVETAYEKCITACRSITYPNECMKKCKIDADAVEQNIQSNSNEVEENFMYTSGIESQNIDITCNIFLYTIAFFILLILLIMVV
jgi:hypothetical protein